jgi:hypothetical protein
VQQSLIATSNLNSSNFLGGLLNKLNDGNRKKNGVLDLLQYGRLSAVQQDHKAEFNQRLQQLELPLLPPSSKKDSV